MRPAESENRRTVIIEVHKLTATQAQKVPMSEALPQSSSEFGGTELVRPLPDRNEYFSSLLI